MTPDHSPETPYVRRPAVPAGRAQAGRHRLPAAPRPALSRNLVLAVPMLLLFVIVLAWSSTSGAGDARTAAADGVVFVETNPSTTRPGEEIGLRASCNDNLHSATVTSDVLGDITVRPAFGFLTATSRVPAGTEAGDYLLVLRCPDGSSAITTLQVVARDDPPQCPAPADPCEPTCPAPADPCPTPTEDCPSTTGPPTTTPTTPPPTDPEPTDIPTPEDT